MTSELHDETISDISATVHMCEHVRKMSGKSFRIKEHLKTQSGEENSSSGRFNPVGRLQQSGCLGSYPP